MRSRYSAFVLGRADYLALTTTQPTTPAQQQLTIMGDRDIPYRLLKKVMVTGARANYSDVSFAVRRKEV